MPSYSQLIEIETEDYGTITLRASSTLKKLKILKKIKNSDTREFVLNAIEGVIQSPKVGLDEIRTWPDKLLEKIVRIWSKEKWGAKWEFETDASVFEDFQENYKAEIEPVMHFQTNGAAH